MTNRVALAALLVLALPSSASVVSAECLPLECCIIHYVGATETPNISHFRIDSVSQGSVQITLLDKPLFCLDGVICSNTALPRELNCYDGVSYGGCLPCEELSVGEEGVLMYVRESSCLLYFTPVEDDKAICSGRKVPVDFVLAQALIKRQDCENEYHENGYAPTCTEASCFGCSHSKGYKVGFFALVLLSLILKRRRL